MQKSQRIGQYEILKVYGNDMAIVRDMMFETSDVYIMAISDQLQLLNIRNYDLTGFPSLINQFEWEGKACFVYKAFEGAHLDTVPYDIDFSVNAIRNLCLSIYRVWKLSGGYFYPKISIQELYFTKDENLVFKNAYIFSAYQECEESFITKQLSYILYQLVTGRNQLDDIRNIDPSFSYILNSTIIQCAEEKITLGLEAFATTLAQYKETDLMVYQQDRSLRPSRRKRNTLYRFTPDPEQLEFHTIKPDIKDESKKGIRDATDKLKIAEKNIKDDHKQKIITDIQERKDETTGKQEVRQKKEILLEEEEKNAAMIKRNQKRSDVQQPTKKNEEENEKKTPQKMMLNQKKQTVKSVERPQNHSKSSFKEQSTNQNNVKSDLERLKQNKNKKTNIKSNDNSDKKSDIKEKPKINIPKKEVQNGQVIPKPKKSQNTKKHQKDSNNKGSWNHIKLAETETHNNEKIKKESSVPYEDKPEKGSKENKRTIPRKVGNHVKQDFHPYEETKKEERKQNSQSKEYQVAGEGEQPFDYFANDSKSERKDQRGMDQEEIKTKNDTEDEETNVISTNKAEIPIFPSSIEKVDSEDTNEIHDISSDNMEQVEPTNSFATLKKEEKRTERRFREIREKKPKVQKVNIPKIQIPKSVRIAIIGSFLVIVGTVGFFAHKTFQQNKYNDMIEVVDRSTNQKEKIRILHQAIDLLPKESKAYERLLDVYLEDAVFSSSEESAYLKTIHQNWDKVKKGDGYGNLAYEIGKAYWYYYEYDNMNNEEITRMKSAVQWFEDSLKYKSTAKHHRIAKIYCEIGKFNQEITLNVKEGTDKGVYKKYYNNLKNLLEIGNSNTVASLELYKLTVNSIDTYRERFIDDGINEEDINQTKQDVLYKVNETSVVTEKEKELKNTILYGSKQ